MECHGWEGPCENTNAVNYRMRTSYVDDELNWRVLCPECQKASDATWDEMWAEYYSGLL